MSTAFVVSIISAVVAVGSAVITALLSAREGRERITLQAELDRRQAVQRRQDERLDLMNRIRDPLLWRRSTSRAGSSISWLSDSSLYIS